MASYNYTFNSGDTVTAARLNDARTVFDIVNADIKSNAAIAGTKISPDFGNQSIATTGQAAVGTAISANAKLNVGGTMPAQTTQRALAVSPTFDNNASVGTQAVITVATTAANGGSSYTIPSLTHFFANQGTLHADSTVTSQYGFYAAANIAGATNNYGFFSAIPSSGTANWNVYAFGTAPNYFAGNVGIGTTSPAVDLHVNGTTRALAYQVSTNQVVGARVTGWGAPTGTLSRAALTLTASATYSQSEMNTVIQSLKAVITDLRTHGLIGA